MNFKTTILTMLLSFGTIFSFAQKVELNLVPQPQEVKVNEGSFALEKSVSIKGNAEFAVKYLKDKIESATGISLQTQGNGERVIEININATSDIKNEGYNLVVTPDKITIVASDNGGAFYGVQTLLQMLPATVYGEATGWEEWSVPCVEINDYPRFAYRGTHLDVSRTFFPLETIYNLLDWLSYHKINKFHWHLTDDNGWRIEIKKYPLLTQKGAWRGPNEVLPPSYGSGNQRYGGFYTQEEIKSVIKYAAQRNIEIIPEIDMPGHSKAVIGCYPNAGCDNDTHFISVNGEVQNVWCIGKEDNYKMLDNIIKEIAALFPSKTLHIGGDEVNMDNWKNCPHCQALMKKEGMKGEIELLNYFVRRLEVIVNKYGKNMAGWDEILDGGDLKPNTIVYAWRTVEKGIDAVKKGQPTVMQIGEYCYFDMKQTPIERGHNWAGIVTLEKTYSLEPLKTFKIDTDDEKLVLGVQGALWTELLNRPARFLDYQYFPRLCAIAEVGWTNAELKDYNDFYYRVSKTHYERMFNMGIAFRLPYPDVKYENNTLKVKLPYDWAVVRYTTDGTEPTSSSNIYTGDIVTFEPQNFRFATFYKDIIKSVTVGASNIDLYNYLTPDVAVTSSYEKELTNKNFPLVNASNYNFNKHWRVDRRSQEGDWVLYTFATPVECSKITVETGIPNITFYGVTDGYVEYSYDGKEFVKGERFKNSIAVIKPKDKVKAVRIKFTGMSDALSTCFQNLRIEK